MNVDLSGEEIDYLIETLVEAHKGLLHEIHHADGNDYKGRLRATAGLNEIVAAKLKEAAG